MMIDPTMPELPPVAVPVQCAALQHLAQTEGYVALGEHHLGRQRELVSELERDGHDTTEARRLLQALHAADRDRLRNELAQKS